MSTTRAALVNSDHLVDAVIVVDLDGTYVAPDGFTVHALPSDSQVGPGWILVGGNFEPPTYASEPTGPTLPTVTGLQAQIDELVDMILMGEM